MNIIKTTGIGSCCWCQEKAIGHATVGEGTDLIKVCLKHSTNSNVHLAK